MFSVSATTRPKREQEVDGRDYFFLTKEQFAEKVGHGELIEWEEIYGERYGSLRSEVVKGLEAGRNVLFDIDVKGALSFKRQYPRESVLIFIKPPGMEVLAQRLRKRKTEVDSTLQKRLERVPMELKMGDEFDYCVINDDLTRAVQEVDEIIRHEIIPVQRV